MADTDGDFAKWKPVTEGYHATCPKCGQKAMRSREWESSDGAYDDTQYRCDNCGRGYWTEGPDA